MYDYRETFGERLVGEIWWEGDAAVGELQVNGETLFSWEAYPQCQDWNCNCVAEHPETAWDEVEGKLRAAATVLLNWKEYEDD